MMKDIWEKIPPEERKKLMQELSLARWKNKTKDERLEHSKMMNRAKLDKNKEV